MITEAIKQQKCLRTSFPTYTNPSTNSGRLSHHMVSLRLGSDALNQWFKTPGSFQTYLLFTMQTEQAQSRLRCANFYFFKRIFFNQPISPPIQARGRRPRLAGTSDTQRREPRQRQDKTNPIASRLVELIGIEPMTPCLQSRCSPS